MDLTQQHAGAAADAEAERSSPRVPDGTRVYAIGDIHGRRDLLSRLLDGIGDDAAGASSTRVVAVFLGDYVDRGPESREVIDLLLGDPLHGFDVIRLKGNHEDFMIRFLEDGSLGDAWLMNGADATMMSYGVDFYGIGRQGGTLAGIRTALIDAVPESHRDFLAQLGLVHLEGDYAFVHAGVRPGYALDEQRESDLLWIRHEFLNSLADFGKIVVHGHSIHAEPVVLANRIGIDTGAFHTNRLTCLVLEGEDRRFLHT